MSNKKLFTIDLLSEKMGVGFASGMVIEFVLKHTKPDHVVFDDLSKAAWYLGRLVSISLQAESREYIIDSFKKGIEGDE